MASINKEVVQTACENFMRLDTVKGFSKLLSTKAGDLIQIIGVGVLEAFTESEQIVCALLVRRVVDKRVFFLNEGELSQESTFGQLALAEDRRTLSHSDSMGPWRHIKGALYNVSGVVYNLTGSAYFLYSHEGNNWLRDAQIFKDRFSKIG
jgi:hypothetical protein